MMHILIAPNAFKHSLDAASAAEAIREGFLQSKLNCDCECFPVGDGGDGTASLLIKKFNGKTIKSTVLDPLGRKINISFGLVDNGKTGVIEMADASGIRLLEPAELDPLHATSFGTGELMRQALDTGVRKIILCIGGSATIDGGTGILKALGIRFLNAVNNDLENLPASLIDLSTIDTSKLDTRILNCELIILCDVENELLGEGGAATIFGPQKGARPEDISTLEAALVKFCDVTRQHNGKDMSLLKHGGAAGGVAAGLSVFLNARLVNGIEHFLGITKFNEALQKADIIITGEGSIDEQTLNGKAPFGVAQKAKEKNIPVIGLAGKIPLNENIELQKYFDVLLSISNEPDLETAMRCTKENLIRTAKAIGNLLALNVERFV
jgi:glycerate kinase